MVEYIKTNNAAPIVMLSAAATGVVGRVDYHEKINKFIGFFFGSIKNRNGFPDSNVLIYRTAEDIVKQFNQIQHICCKTF